jgi:outer membrane beta-barrel protein
VGVLPVDPYFKGLTGTFGYTVHLSDNWAWEVAQLSYAYNLETSLYRKLVHISNAGGRDAPEIPAIQWVAASHLVLKPLYGKEAVFNTRVLHLEAFLEAGPAVVGMTGAAHKLDLGVDVGAGLRVWLSEAWSTRFDLGEMVFFHRENASTRVRQALTLRLGLALTFGGDE